jgi:predicted Fe-S protein YdhL (DUF1289 family)
MSRPVILSRRSRVARSAERRRTVEGHPADNPGRAAVSHDASTEGGPSTVLRCFGFAYAAPAAQHDKSSPRRRIAITALFLLLILGCHRTNIDRAQWQSMSATEKSLYVRTLLGHEKTKEAKGGNDRVFTRSIDDYVKGIDDAYARGDMRTVDAIFESMGSPR